MIAGDGMPKSEAKHDFDLAAASSALFRTRATQIGWFLLLALVSRVSVYGDPAYFNDEEFYFQVGLRMHDGQLPYVDMWDRKGPGLFLTYWFITFFSKSVVGYQIAATLAAAATAYCVNLIAEPFTTRIGAVLGGSLYLVLIVLFGGGGGQSPVFYNLPMALAVLAVVHSSPVLKRGEVGWPIYAAMAAAGFAVTFKQTAIVESLFLGGAVLWQLCQAKVAPSRLIIIALVMAAVGAAPYVLFGVFYALVGHFPEFWHAMVTANLRKVYNPADDAWKRIATLSALMSPALFAALAGLLLPPKHYRTPRIFLACWLSAAVAGVAIIPNFYEHYVLPLCLPVSVAASLTFGYRQIGTLIGYGMAMLILMMGSGTHFTRRAESRQAMSGLVRDIKARDPHPRVLVYQGPVDLYRQLDSYPPSPLYYPMHPNFTPEHNVSHLDTQMVMRQLLSDQPTVVVIFHKSPVDQESPFTAPLVHQYIAEHCQLWFTRQLREVYADPKIDVWGCSSKPR
jgi:hypothetical protein